MMEPPFEVKPFEEMNKREAQKHFDWYVGQICDRIRLLKRAFETTGGGTAKELDLSPESLKALWRWFQGHVNYVEKTKKQIQKEYERMPELLQASERHSNKEPSRETLILAMDVAIYFGEVFTKNCEKVSWGFVTKPRSLAYVNRPVLVGFRNTQLDPRMIIINSLKKNKPDALYELFMIWTEGL